MNDRTTDVRSIVIQAILENSEIGQAIIEVENQDGNITLKGIAETEEDKKLAEAIVSRQEGVLNVINELTCD